MYRSILGGADADPIDLVDLATVKDELGIEDSGSDDRLARWITDVSGQINTYVGRVLRAQDVTETFTLMGSGPARNDGYWPERYGWGDARHAGGLNLARYPIVSVTSVIENDDLASLVDNVDYECDQRAGILYRRTGSGTSPTVWGASCIVAIYRGGWETTDDVPGGVRDAVCTMIAYRRGARARDPGIRSISIPGVSEKSYFAPASTGAVPVGGLPPEVASAVDFLRGIRM